VTFRRLIHVVFAALLACGSSPAAKTPPAKAGTNAQALDRQFQAASAAYNAGRFAEAAVQLENLLHKVPESFEVQELLGLVYSAQSDDAKANPLLEKAVRLKPGSAAARTNLAANLTRLGKLDLAQAQFLKAAELDPKSYDTNHNLGEAYVRAGQLAKAQPFLAQAQKVNPASYDNGYDLALAYLLTNRLADARHLAQDLLKLDTLKPKDAAELHNLLGEVEEKDGNFVPAANEFQAAAHADPSESNLFDWASELLLHRTLDPAVDVFTQATERYPKSARLAIGLGMAYYARGNYDDAVKSLLRGADLNPSDPDCYLFLSKAYNSSPGQAEDVIARFRRFSELQPANAKAQYYYAMSLWKGKRAEDTGLDLSQIEALLKKSLALDPNSAEAHLQLGNLYSDQTKFAEAIPEYETARKLDPDLADVRYRLGQAYVRTGKKDLAQEEFAIYQKLREQHLADLDKQRAEIRQFVYSAKDGAGGKPE
jgi:tetratricopeptide (TPR) repeat protein